MNNYFLGIDNGGSVTKAVLFEISSAVAKAPMFCPMPGFTERNMEALWQANVDVIHRAVRESAIHIGRIAGAACIGHGKGMHLWGWTAGRRTNGIVSTDARAWKYPAQWVKDGTAEKVFPKVMQQPLACQPAAL
jgi:L-xylulokinase